MKKSLHFLTVLALLTVIVPNATADTFIVNPHLTYDSTIALMTAQVDTVFIKYYMEGLQSFLYHNVYMPNHDSTTQWLVDQFTMMGISDIKQDTFYHPGANKYCYNVVATIHGLYDTSIVYIAGGHYDTPISITSDRLDTIYSPGADDNGSGTTAVLEMARLLALPGNRPNCTVRFIAFDAEESGLLGSLHYAGEAYQQNMNIGLMSNYDCIGSWLCDTLYHSCPDSGSEGFAELLCRTTEWYGHDGANTIKAVLGGIDAGDNVVFRELGYPTSYSQEYNHNFSVMHSAHDSTTYINYPAMANIIRGGLGLMATVTNYPRVSKLSVNDIGSGTELLVAWAPDIVGNIEFYNIYWGPSSGGYTDSATTGLTEYTITGLEEGSLYYVGVIAIDDSFKESPVITEVTGIPRSIPLIPSNMIVAPVDSGISLFWLKNLEIDMAGYEVYSKIDDGYFDSLTVVVDTHLVIKPLSGANKYYYKVRAFDADGNYSLFTDSAYARPITLDQGILLVDETNNWTTTLFPRDTQQDSFYNYLLSGYKYEQYDFGSTAQKPVLGDFGPYSTVLWHSDDPSQFLSSNDSSALREYLSYGGKLWFTGWKPTGDIRNSATYPASYAAGNILYDYFKVSYAELSGTNDSLKAVIGLNGYPGIVVDTLKYPASTLWGQTFRNIEALTPLAGADTIYVMDMKNNESPYEGRACAVRDSGKVVLFGFPLYYMDKDQARLAAQKVMLEFGEVPLGVTGGTDNRGQITGVRLFQNVPNPFSDQTAIRYQMPKAGQVKLNVYNIAGQKVKTLVDEAQQAGSYSIKWDRQDNKGRQVSAGVYIYHLSIGDQTQTRKMIVLK